MIKINKKVEYALIALKYMATHKFEGDSLTSAREICDRFKTPFDTTAKVLQVMNNNGLLNSTKGIKGGYSLAKPLSEVTFTELSFMIEGGTEAKKFCESSKGLCDLYNICNIVDPIDTLNNKIYSFLSQLTLEELLLKDKNPFQQLAPQNMENA
jgi:Rrf2 family protein